MRQRLLSAIAVPAAIVLLAACGNDADSAGSQSSSAIASASETSSPEPSQSDSSAPESSAPESDSSAMESGTASSTSTDDSDNSSESSSADESSSAERSSAGSDDTSAAETGGGAAQSGGVLKSGSIKKLPASVGQWKKQAGSPGDPAVLYENDGALISIGGTLMSSPYEDLAKLVTIKKTKAGTGVCGAAMSADNLTCYLKAADGTVNISASTEDTQLPELITFVNDLTKALGTN